MASQRIKFTVGLFVAGGMAIAVVAIIWLGMSNVWQKGMYYATYFNESVQGLDIDSQVKYRGVSIGRVDRIGVAPDLRLIEVILKIESKKPLESDLVAQLKIVGITGSMFVELDRKKPGEPDRSPRLSFPTKYPVVASKPSDISELLRGIDDIVNQIKALDLDGISKRIKSTLDSINQMVADANIKGISTSANRLLVKATETFRLADRAIGRIEGMVTAVQDPLKTALKDFSDAVAAAEALFKKGESFIGQTNDSVVQLKGHLLVVGKNLERASENLDRLIETVSDQPSQLLFGQPPAPRKIKKGTSKK